MRKNVVSEHFFTSLTSGDRVVAREIVAEHSRRGATPPEEIYETLFWPTLTHLQNLYRGDQLSELAHHYATRLLRTLVDQMQPRLKQASRLGKKVLLTCGPEESEELGAQMLCDLLEAHGFEVYFAGGGIANDEIVNQVGELSADVLAVFGAMPRTVPMTRTLIDHLHSIGVCPNLQIAVGGGVFNRAEGLAEEIGADLWASTPLELVNELLANPERRMKPEQRTVGGKRRVKKKVVA